MAKQKGIDATEPLFGSFGEQLPSYLFNAPSFISRELLAASTTYLVRRQIRHEGVTRAYLFVEGEYMRVEGYVTLAAPQKKSIEEIIPLFGERKESMRKYLAGLSDAWLMAATNPQSFNRWVRLEEMMAACPSFLAPADGQYISLMDDSYARLRALLRDRPTPSSKDSRNPGCSA